MIPFPENPNHPLSNKNKREGFWAGCTATRQLAHDLGYRKVPSVEQIAMQIFDGTALTSAEAKVSAIVVHAMLMKEEK